MIRNLIMHIWPVAGRGVWQWNVEQLLRRIDQFNGQRIVSVVTDDNTDSLDQVRSAFKGTVTEFLHFRNDPALGEVVSFHELLRRVASVDARHLTFYCHAKGVRYQPNAKPTVRHWTTILYAHLLDYPSVVEASLRDKVMFGTFQKLENQFGSWHYAGTFFWFKNDRVFCQPSWNQIPRHWLGVEAWPGTICDPSAADCMYQGKAYDMNMYARELWDSNLDEVWKQWKMRQVPLQALDALCAKDI